ncbi:hypothetical protein ASG43_21785 [Aureimonas sp. Leaf454]|uniref:hypothetical protein n=1 Tax=Aureimonas sp. Leaf454 TaxID=1736381 RepID=UPI00070030CB|nr:hypothetical protein [Aureimonas sp. Leaf454]KQT50189.1 hypothetical protein ASG43_21785 [Aureimonas sp. Leaf454]
MLNATDDERKDVREYFEGQAPDLTITFMQKVYSEAVIGHRHDVWDIHTNVDRWWVITNPTNLYSQEQFPNMDLVVTFHMGLCLRIPRTRKQRLTDERIRPLGAIFEALEQISDAVGQAQNVADYQAIGVRCREALLLFIGAAQDMVDWDVEEPAKRADFPAWTGVICNTALGGDGQKERRRLLKTSLTEAWTFTNWLTHTKSATWYDAEMASATVEHVLGFAASLLLRHAKGVPEDCPECGSRKLSPEEGLNSAAPHIVWERPVCADCGWAGRPVPVAVADDSDQEAMGLITREGGTGRDDECSIMTVPLRDLKAPSSR